jgi:hypothetical protein
MRNRHTNRMAAKRGRAISVVMGLLLLGGLVPGAASVAAAATPHSVGTQTSAAQLVQQYLSTLGVAGSKAQGRGGTKGVRTLRHNGTVAGSAK